MSVWSSGFGTRALEQTLGGIRWDHAQSLTQHLGRAKSVSMPPRVFLQRSTAWFSQRHTHRELRTCTQTACGCACQRFLGGNLARRRQNRVSRERPQFREAWIQTQIRKPVVCVHVMC